MSDTLHIFALTADSGLRHTHLTRAEGLAPALPPLTEWLGAEVDTDEIELFPLRDIAPMSLSDYVTMAFAPEAMPPDLARRLDALKGSVLLVPERALSEEPAPGAALRLVASLPLARADHTADLPRAAVTPMPRPAPAAPAPAQGRRTLPWVMLGLGAILLVLLWVM